MTSTGPHTRNASNAGSVSTNAYADNNNNSSNYNGAMVVSAADGDGRNYNNNSNRSADGYAMEPYANDSHNSNSNRVPPQAEDLINEVLAMNTLAMQRCKEGSLDEALDILSEAYEKLSTRQEEEEAGSAGDDRSNSNERAGGVEEEEERLVIEDAQLLDKLRSTTLNNMGVVECHRGDPQRAIQFFESARALEEGWGIASPALALNACAAYNTLGMYDRATAAALETIEMLRTAAVQKRQEKKRKQQQHLLENGGTALSSSRKSAKQRERQRREEEEYLATAGQPKVAESANKALWGAAWHNLAIAQLNTAKANGNRDTTEHSNAFALFRNALRATQDLLGADHPMTREVTESYRAARSTLRKQGAFKQHHTQATAALPPVDPRKRELALRQAPVDPGTTRARSLANHARDLTITLRGDATQQKKFTETMDSTAYPGAAADNYGVAELFAHSARRGRSNRNNRSRSRSKSRRGRSGKQGKSRAGGGSPYVDSFADADAIYHGCYKTPRALRDMAATAPATMLGTGHSRCSARQCAACEDEGCLRFSPDATLDWVKEQQQQQQQQRGLPPITGGARQERITAAANTYAGQSKFLLLAKADGEAAPAPESRERSPGSSDEAVGNSAIRGTGNRDLGRPDYYYAVSGGGGRGHQAPASPKAWIFNGTYPMLAGVAERMGATTTTSGSGGGERLAGSARVGSGGGGGAGGGGVDDGDSDTVESFEL